MRIHIQSKLGVANFPITRELWLEAVARAPDIGAGHDVSFGLERVELEAGMRDAEVLITQTSALLDGGLPAAPRLRLIYVTSAGLERLAPFDWLPPGVSLLNNRGTHAVKAGEYGLMALLLLVNRMPALMTAQRERRWAPMHGRVLAGSHLVVVGLGTLGGTAAQQARRLGMRVTGVRATAAPHPACDRVVAAGELDHVLPDAAFLYLATPLTPATRHLLNRERIGRLPRGAGVVNVGRGGLVEQDALFDALEAGHLGGAVIDVFEPEPLPPEHRAWRVPNLIITPHVSADDPATYNARSLDIFLENLRAFRDGQPMQNRFDIERGY